MSMVIKKKKNTKEIEKTIPWQRVTACIKMIYKNTILWKLPIKEGNAADWVQRVYLASNLVLTWAGSKHSAPYCLTTAQH